MVVLTPEAVDAAAAAAAAEAALLDDDDERTACFFLGRSLTAAFDFTGSVFFLPTESKFWQPLTVWRCGHC